MKIITDAPPPSTLITAPKNPTGNEDMSSLSKNDLFAMLIANENKSANDTMQEGLPADTNQAPEPDDASTSQQALMTPDILDMFKLVMLYQGKLEDKHQAPIENPKTDVNQVALSEQAAQLPASEPVKVANETNDQVIQQVTQQPPVDALQANLNIKFNVQTEKQIEIATEKKPTEKLKLPESTQIPLSDKPKTISVNQINKIMVEMQRDSDESAGLPPLTHKANTSNPHVTFEQPFITPPVAPAIHDVDSMNKLTQMPTGMVENKLETIQLKGRDQSTVKLSIELPERIVMNSTGKETYHANIKIYPPEMGKIEARIRMDNNKANLIITTENNQVTDILKANISMLKDHFTQSHLNLDKIDIQTSLSFQGQEQKQQLKENQSDERMPVEKVLTKATQAHENKENKSDSTIDTYI